MKLPVFLSTLIVGSLASPVDRPPQSSYTELYRPQFHFSPRQHWINDPNGLVYANGLYHLYYQYNPGGDTWGAMSWGHATSKDLTHWKEQPVALLARGFPDNITEMFFSGSIVVDEHNTSGFGTRKKTPWVAMYTSSYTVDQTLPSGKHVRQGQQGQSIAYSLDEGLTWTTYDQANPILLDPPSAYKDQFLDFRDPNVFWHEPTGKWVVTLSLPKLYKILIYTSTNLKDWTLASEFGPANAVGGMWECPSLTQLPLDNNKSKWVMMVGLNPGGPPGTVGSGNQYIVGDFDGTKFTADSDSIYDSNAPAGSVIFQDFEGSQTFAERGWTATGDFAGKSPVAGTLAGQLPVAGYKGAQLVNTFLNGDLTTGTLTSPQFKIEHKYINFLIGGGSNLEETAIRLKINGSIVDAATGANDELLTWHSWDVTPYLNQNAAIEIIDTATGGWGHINIDEISFADSPANAQVANWVDMGPDFYAAIGFNGLPLNQRTLIGWMNNWQYGNLIPTGPWRGAMTIPRRISLKTIGQKITLVQEPAEDWKSITGGYKTSKFSSIDAAHSLGSVGQALEINLSFSYQQPSATGKREFGIVVRATEDFSQQTRVGYDFATQRVFVDRSASGVIVDNTFGRTYSAPLAPSRDGTVTLRIFVDWSSVEVFGGQGESTITTQIFPSSSATYAQLFSTGGSTKNVNLQTRTIDSTWR